VLVDTPHGREGRPSQALTLNQADLESRAARRAQPGQHLRPGVGDPLPDRGERPGPAITAAIPTAASACRRPRLFRGSRA
jgi:hypothetical protein